MYLIQKLMSKFRYKVFQNLGCVRADAISAENL